MSSPVRNTSISLNSNCSQSVCNVITNIPKNLFQWTSKFLNINRSNSNYVFFKSPLHDEVIIHILNFLGKQDLRVMDSVSKYFRPLINTACQRECIRRGFIPERLPNGINYKIFLLNRFPNARGVDCIRKCIGDVKESDKLIPVPENHILRATPDSNECFCPENFIIEVDENSPFELDETTAVGNNKARLIENPGKKDLEATGKTKKLTVPRTLNNMNLIFQRCLKKNILSKFAGIDPNSWQNILAQHGDADVGPSHWSCQRKKAIGPGEPYNDQAELAGKEGLEIVRLADRVFFELLTHVHTGKIPQNDYFERTSTPTLDNNGHPCQSGIYWPVSGPLFRLGLDYCQDQYILFYNEYNVGAAVAVPSESSND